MRAKSESQVPDASGIRFDVLDGGAFVLHNAHVQKGTGPGHKGCKICRPGMGQIAGVLEIVSRDSVGQGSRDDKEETTSSAPRGPFWSLFDEPESEVQDKG